jgi:pimeloyl-ACP methyl ester carboxylesterase
MAGFNVRLYAELYRPEVIGMILVDASHPYQLQRFPPALHAMSPSWIREAEFLEFMEPIGIPRLLGYCGNDVSVRAAECTLSSFRESASERRTFRESAAQTAAIAGDLGSMPLVVLSHDTDKPDPDLTADVDKATNSAFNQMQEELSRLSTEARRVIAKGSGHYIQQDRPKLVIDAVHQIVDQVRSKPVAGEKQPAWFGNVRQN